MNSTFTWTFYILQMSKVQQILWTLFITIKIAWSLWAFEQSNRNRPTSFVVISFSTCSQPVRSKNANLLMEICNGIILNHTTTWCRSNEAITFCDVNTSVSVGVNEKRWGKKCEIMLMSLWKLSNYSQFIQIIARWAFCRAFRTKTCQWIFISRLNPSMPLTVSLKLKQALLAAQELRHTFLTLD